MKSLDTNILFYALNRDCREHEACRSLIEKALTEAELWIIADQVWFELYRLLRNSTVLEKPLTAGQASEAIDWYRNKSGWLRCAWETDMMKHLEAIWRHPTFPARRCFDARLAVVLKENNVREFYTRNVHDFEGFEFFEVLDPVLRAST